jgi:hypothetical protein
MRLTKQHLHAALLATACLVTNGSDAREHDDDKHHDKDRQQHQTAFDSNAQLGPRPYYLIDDMDEGELKDELSACDGRYLTKAFPMMRASRAASPSASASSRAARRKVSM